MWVPPVTPKITQRSFGTSNVRSEQRTPQSGQPARQSPPQASWERGDLGSCAQEETVGRQPAPGGIGARGGGPFQEGWILGRPDLLSSPSALLPKGVLPLFLSFFDASTDSSFLHQSTPRTGQRSRMCAPRSSCSQVRDRLEGPQPALNSLALQGQRQALRFPAGPRTLQPCKVETGLMVPSWVLQPAACIPER